MPRKYKRKKGTKIGNAKKITYKSVTFDSHLELYMYKLLESAKLDFTYNEKSYILSEGFTFPNDSYERLGNGKGEFKNRGKGKLRDFTYKPDFIVGDEEFIIETKGWANETFPVRWKFFKKHIMENNKNSILMKPQTKKECDICLNIILSFYE